MIRELLFFGRENFVFLKFSRLNKSSSLTSCAVGLVTVIDHSFERAGNLNFKRVTNGPQGTVASKTAKPVHFVEKGLNKLRINLAEVNPTHKIEPEVCFTLQLESQHGVSHFKHPSWTVLEYARDLGNTMRESLKLTSQWSAYYFTRQRSYYPAPENSISLRDIPKISPIPPKEMSRAD